MEGEAVFIQDGMYFKDTNNNLNKFEGIWEYSDANRRLRIVLEKIEDYEDAGYFSDVIVGNIIYEENGVEIINTLTNPSTSQGSDDIYHLNMFSIKNPTRIGGWFEDPINSKWTTYRILLTHSVEMSMGGIAQEKLEWRIQPIEFYNPDNDVDASQELRVPRELILTKM
jgi:hypothetical protein